MLNTKKTIKEAADMWKEMMEENGITDEDINDSEYDYMDED